MKRLIILFFFILAMDEALTDHGPLYSNSKTPKVDLENSADLISPSNTNIFIQTPSNETFDLVVRLSKYKRPISNNIDSEYVSLIADLYGINNTTKEGNYTARMIASSIPLENIAFAQDVLNGTYKNIGTFSNNEVALASLRCPDVACLKIVQEANQSFDCLKNPIGNAISDIDKALIEIEERATIPDPSTCPVPDEYFNKTQYALSHSGDKIPSWIIRNLWVDPIKTTLDSPCELLNTSLNNQLTQEQRTIKSAGIALNAGMTILAGATAAEGIAHKLSKVKTLSRVSNVDKLGGAETSVDDLLREFKISEVAYEKSVFRKIGMAEKLVPGQKIFFVADSANGKYFRELEVVNQTGKIDNLLRPTYTFKIKDGKTYRTFEESQEALGQIYMNSTQDYIHPLKRVKKGTTILLGPWDTYYSSAGELTPVKLLDNKGDFTIVKYPDGISGIVDSNRIIRPDISRVLDLSKLPEEEADRMRTLIQNTYNNVYEQDGFVLYGDGEAFDITKVTIESMKKLPPERRTQAQRYFRNLSERHIDIRGRTHIPKDASEEYIAHAAGTYTPSQRRITYYRPHGWDDLLYHETAHDRYEIFVGKLQKYATDNGLTIPEQYQTSGFRTLFNEFYAFKKGTQIGSDEIMTDKEILTMLTRSTLYKDRFTPQDYEIFIGLLERAKASKSTIPYQLFSEIKK